VTTPHPFAPFSYRAGLGSLVVALLSLGLWRAWPTDYAADLTGLLAGYALAVGLLEAARRWQHGTVLAGWTALGLILASWGGAWLAAFLHGQRHTPHQWHGELRTALLAVLCVLILPGLIRRWLAWREARLLAAQAAQLGAERALLEARLAALQGQIEPHFLYNTLANVQYLLRHDGERADHMLDRLIAYLRAALPDLRQPQTTLEQELARVRAYLDIMAIRMGDRLHYEIDCPPALAAACLPSLAVATLVENALKHGLEGKPGPGKVVIEARQRASQLEVTVTDDGLGFSEAGSENGVGLRNLQARLTMLYGEAASLRLAAPAAGGVQASLTLPLRWQPEPVNA
jgi:two-component sensor histidine kinase